MTRAEYNPAVNWARRGVFGSEQLCDARGGRFLMNNQSEERFLTAMAAERQRLVSRRGVLRGAVAAAGGGALAIAAIPGAAGLRSLLAQDFNDDLEILNYALTLEHLENAFYRDGLNQFNEEDFMDALAEAAEDEDAGDSGDVAEIDDEDEVSVYARLEEVRDHEQAHVNTLSQTIVDLGGVPVNEGTYDFGYGDDALAFLTTAQALENTGVAAYAGAAPQIQDDGILTAALSIHSVEARHAAYINEQLDGAPFPGAFDDPLSPDEVLAIAGDFIVSDGEPADEATPGEDVSTADDATETASSEETPTGAAATEVPPTEVPPTQVPPTQVPPTAVPPTAVPPTQVPPTQVPATAVPPTQAPPAAPTGTVEDELVLPATSTP